MNDAPHNAMEARQRAKHATGGAALYSDVLSHFEADRLDSPLTVNAEVDGQAPSSQQGGLTAGTEGPIERLYRDYASPLGEDVCASLKRLFRPYDGHTMAEWEAYGGAQKATSKDIETWLTSEPGLNWEPPSMKTSPWLGRVLERETAEAVLVEVDRRAGLGRLWIDTPEGRELHMVPLDRIEATEIPFTPISARFVAERLPHGYQRYYVELYPKEELVVPKAAREWAAEALAGLRKND